MIQLAGQRKYIINFLLPPAVLLAWAILLLLRKGVQPFLCFILFYLFFFCSSRRLYPYFVILITGSQLEHQENCHCCLRRRGHALGISPLTSTDSLNTVKFAVIGLSIVILVHLDIEIPMKYE